MLLPAVQSNEQTVTCCWWITLCIQWSECSESVCLCWYEWGGIDMEHFSCFTWIHNVDPVSFSFVMLILLIHCFQVLALLSLELRDFTKKENKWVFSYSVRRSLTDVFTSSFAGLLVLMWQHVPGLDGLGRLCVSGWKFYFPHYNAKSYTYLPACSPPN